MNTNIEFKILGYNKVVGEKDLWINTTIFYLKEILPRAVYGNVLIKNEVSADVENDDDFDDNRGVKATLSLEQVDNLLDIEVDFFVSCRNLNFFEKFGINTEFLILIPIYGVKINKLSILG